MRNNIIKKIFFGSLIFLLSCSESYTPKPRGFNRFDKPEYSYAIFENKSFSIPFSTIARIEPLKQGSDSEYWFNIDYPKYGARVYCTYLPITRSLLGKAIDDSYHLAYSHTLKADDILPQIYSDSVRGIGGLIYDIEGDVATPLQFFVTDSTANFLRGSLYFDKDVNIDSVAPIIEWVRDDIVHIMESITWKK